MAMEEVLPIILGAFFTKTVSFELVQILFIESQASCRVSQAMQDHRQPIVHNICWRKPFAMKIFDGILTQSSRECRIHSHPEVHSSVGSSG